ncbi:gustatory receptor-like Holozoa [Brevipalpus obovatus]|uniref:gustatory receptor-like Holozoa n=1 Tax=Brevipalpus obovatus TaxID=246614 RepID=UPI003D9E11CB
MDMNEAKLELGYAISKSGSFDGTTTGHSVTASDGHDLSSGIVLPYSFVNVNVDTHESTLENSTAAVLNYCKSKVLRPYFKVLSTLAWRPLFPPRSTIPILNSFSRLVNGLYSLLIIIFILSGYFLQYCICYRGDGLHHLTTSNSDPFEEVCDLSLPMITQPKRQQKLGYRSDLPLDKIGIFLEEKFPDQTPHSDYLVMDDDSEDDTDYLISDTKPSKAKNNKIANFINLPKFINKSINAVLPSNMVNSMHTCNTKIVSHFIIPDLLHFLGYLYVFYLMRNPDCERLENLMERGFLQTSRTTGWLMENRRLVNRLRLYLLMALIWTLLSVGLHLIHFNIFQVCFPCLPWSNDPQLRSILVYLTVASLTCFDIICIAVVTNYAVHCQLNISYINNLCRSIREKRITLQEFYKRVEESRKFLDYLNNDQALGVFLLLVVFVCKICIFLYELLAKNTELTKGIIIGAAFMMWVSLLLVPLIQGVRLTNVCKELKRIGHEIRSRPFGYQDITRAELDSLLLYTTTLDMEAKIFHVPMRSSSLIMLFLAAMVFLPLLGQINIISV